VNLVNRFYHVVVKLLFLRVCLSQNIQTAKAFPTTHINNQIRMIFRSWNES